MKGTLQLWCALALLVCVSGAFAAAPAHNTDPTSQSSPDEAMQKLIAGLKDLPDSDTSIDLATLSDIKDRLEKELEKDPENKELKEKLEKVDKLIQNQMALAKGGKGTEGQGKGQDGNSSGGSSEDSTTDGAATAFDPSGMGTVGSSFPTESSPKSGLGGAIDRFTNLLKGGERTPPKKETSQLNVTPKYDVQSGGSVTPQAIAVPRSVTKEEMVDKGGSAAPSSTSSTNFSPSQSVAPSQTVMLPAAKPSGSSNSGSDFPNYSSIPSVVSEAQSSSSEQTTSGRPIERGENNWGSSESSSEPTPRLSSAPIRTDSAIRSNTVEGSFSTSQPTTAFDGLAAGAMVGADEAALAPDIREPESKPTPLPPKITFQVDTPETPVTENSEPLIPDERIAKGAYAPPGQATVPMQLSASANTLGDRFSSMTSANGLESSASSASELMKMTNWSQSASLSPE